MVATTSARVARHRSVLVVMCVGMFLVQLDVTAVNVALPRIADDLGTSLAGQQWVVDGYAVVLAGGTIFVSTLYLQTVRGHAPFAAGLMLLPLFLPLALMAPVTGRPRRARERGQQHLPAGIRRWPSRCTAPSPAARASTPASPTGCTSSAWRVAHAGSRRSVSPGSRSVASPSRGRTVPDADPCSW
ncbi:hypothetical protein [Actinophytocola sp.]|uniref:hypothetical protein n=1 Tax=Actinophytocola sp. TaxID=1872138 RepID=UPI0025C18522|nr:hypothetical protein [Actinophytocola sp.]